METMRQIPYRIEILMTYPYNGSVWKDKWTHSSRFDRIY
jgi:hypothetical protein